jgi:uncharacterized coiled-coil protein SlyX
MEENQEGGHCELQRQIDDLRARVDRNRADIDALESRADRANSRADASDGRTDEAHQRADAIETRAGEADRRADVSEDRSVDDRRRIAELEARLDVNEKIMAELQTDELIDHDHAVHLQEALRTSRMIGAAIGIVMSAKGVSEVEAFAIISRASQNTNHKVRLLAEEVVSSGDTSPLRLATGQRRSDSLE